MNRSGHAIEFDCIPTLTELSARGRLLAKGNPSGDTQSEIIGESRKLRCTLEQIEMVGPTDSTVLIEGETGTGKALIAKGIHSLSSRRDHAFVEVNCAAIPTGLIESELFGHERGAFTGACAQRLGRFEVADKGTLFLDEIGDIPIELQPKLLRVLQERQFERLGSTRTLHSHVRLVAATHRNLAGMVAEGKFREDLYYRLNVFPVTVPPLRERREDIPLLVWHFAETFARRMNKQIDTIPLELMGSLTQCSWPGNIRELQSFIERAVIVSRGPVLDSPPLPQVAAPEPVTLKDAERCHILHILDEAKGVVAAAATRLAVPRSTLFYKMRRLGIIRPRSEKSEKLNVHAMVRHDSLPVDRRDPNDRQLRGIPFKVE
jgi:formate hydrogenlyase transcriptional activator